MFASRDSDERLLQALKLKRQGLSWPAIAERLGFHNHVSLQGSCLAIKKADIAESGEPKSKVWSAYW